MLRIMRGQELPLDQFPDKFKFAVQLNDTDPAIGVAESLCQPDDTAVPRAARSWAP